MVLSGTQLRALLGSGNIAVLSPHSDDAALSLGGTLLLAAEFGHACTIITPFSRSRRTRTGGIESDEERVTAMRKREDEAFVRLLGEGARALWCGIPDPSVRLSGTRDTWYVPRPLSVEERGFMSRIASFCDEHVPEGSVLFAPLGLGRNRDHLMAQGAALEFVRRSPRKLFFYEDLPYASRMRSREVERDVAKLADDERLGLTPRTVAYPALIFRKRRAIAGYASQVNHDIVNRILAHAMRAGSLMSAAERVWEAEFLESVLSAQEPGAATHPSHA